MLPLLSEALYTEPRLSISFNATKVTMQYEAEGFPEPEVRWLGEMGQNLSHTTEYSRGVDKEVGLYYLKSSHEAKTPTLKITFILKNQLLNQDLQRLVIFSHAGEIFFAFQKNRFVKRSLVKAVVLYGTMTTQRTTAELVILRKPVVY